MRIREAHQELLALARYVSTLRDGHIPACRLVEASRAILEAGSTEYRSLYARLFQSMSLPEAKATLGFPPEASPTPEEVAHAYRTKVFENHPDRGGDPSKMVEVNVAKEILDGKRRPDHEHGTPSTPHTEPSWQDENEPQTSEEEMWAEEKRAREYLDQNAKKGKKHEWWVPPHNFMINQALMEWNFWAFSILPMFPAKKAYRPANPKTGRPEGIVIHPLWNDLRDMPSVKMLTVKLAERLVSAAKTYPTVQESVKEELRWIEEKFKVTIPEPIKAKLIAEAPKVATRRMAVDRLRVKDTLIPFDGSKPIDLGMFDW
jgi:hypothetical protein